jgi:hypothetical protein
MLQLVRNHIRRMLDRFALVLGQSRSVKKHRAGLKKEKRKSPECELSINAPTVDNGILHCSARLSIPGNEPQDVWFKLPEQWRLAVTGRADPFIIATLFAAVESRCALRVIGGSASPSLLRNLAEFQHVWHSWLGFDVIKIHADTQPDRGLINGPSIACFSGGIDSAYTAYRHAGKRRDRQAHPGFTAMMVHGFDIPIADEDGFRCAGERSRRMLESLAVPLILMHTNIRSLSPNWEISHGTAVAAVLTLLSGKFSTGLIPATGTYDLPLTPWGSNPLTDPMLGSRSFEIVHHGARASRLDKVRLLCNWDKAVKQLRFCFQNTPSDGNCGRCMKCILTALEFRCAGVEPGCFAESVTDDIIMEVLERYKPNAFGDFFFREVLNTALAQGMTDVWVMKLKETVATFRSRQ